MVAQVAALDHPEAFSALTLVGTRPVAPGPDARLLVLERASTAIPDGAAGEVARAMLDL
jgi:hypothetical protein